MEEKYYVIGEILENGEIERGKTDNGEAYINARAFAHKTGTCYVPELSDTKYSYGDFLALAKGNEKLARVLFSAVDWQAPETLLDEYISNGEVKECDICLGLYLTYGDEEAIHEECFNVPESETLKIGTPVMYNGEEYIIGDLDETPVNGMYPTNLNYYIILKDESYNTFVHHTEVEVIK